MNDWFESLDARERQFVAVGSVAVIIALIYSLFWMPLDKKHTQLQADVDKWQNAIVDLRPLGVAITNGGQTESTVRSSSQESPLIIVNDTLQTRGLESYQRNSQPTSSNGIRVVLEDIAFDELVLWLGELSENYSMHVQNGSFSAGPGSATGRVNATLTLERSL